MSNEIQTANQSLLSESNFDHAYRVANMMSTTQMIPKQFQNKPADILVAFEFGRTLGLGQLQAVQNIAVINGRPTMWGDAVLAVCQGHQEFEYIIEDVIKNEKGEMVGYECKIKRKSYPEETVRRFTIDNAKKANLWGKAGPWSQYPDRMLQIRARGFALRDTFADALSGISIREEVQDMKEAKDITPKKDMKEDLKQLITKNKKESTNDSEEKS